MPAAGEMIAKKSAGLVQVCYRNIRKQVLVAASFSFWDFLSGQEL
jgi:hypothetical protein